MHEPRQATCVEEPLEVAQVGQASWVGRHNTRAGRNGGSQFDGELRFGTHLYQAGRVGEELNKGATAFASTSVSRESCCQP